jgi:hypothetical protein
MLARKNRVISSDGDSREDKQLYVDDNVDLNHWNCTIVGMKALHSILRQINDVNTSCSVRPR